MYRFDAYLSDEAKAPVLNQIAALKEKYGVGGRRVASIVAPPRPQQLSLLGLAVATFSLPEGALVQPV
jgi:hypothetical protein